MLESQDLWKIVEKEFKEPSSPQKEDRLTEGQRNVLKGSKKRDKKSFVALYQVIDKINFEKISNTKPSKES